MSREDEEPNKGAAIQIIAGEYARYKAWLDADQEWFEDENDTTAAVVIKVARQGTKYIWANLKKTSFRTKKTKENYTEAIFLERPQVLRPIK